MTDPGTPQVIANFVLFQAGWFACVLGAAHGWPWIGTAVVAAIIVWHLWSAAQPAQEAKLIAMALLIGASWDSVLVMLGWIAYPAGTLIAGAAPHWILALWALFATALNVSMRWLKQRLLLAVALGVICGPLSYWGAARLGAVEFIDPVRIVIALAVGWGLIMPALMRLSRRYDGMTAPEKAPA
jgi:Protein of unknown function (DUF2878)